MSSTKPLESRATNGEGVSVDDTHPFREYAGLMSLYAVLAAGLGLVARRTGKLPERVGGGDLVWGALAVHKASRILARDPITSPIRAPFTELEGVEGPAELRERVTGSGWRKAIGELLTCPFCLGQWLATFYVFGLGFAPRFTRAVAATFAIHAGSDALQLAYARLEKAAADQDPR